MTIEYGSEHLHIGSTAALKAGASDETHLSVVHFVDGQLAVETDDMEIGPQRVPASDPEIL